MVIHRTGSHHNFVLNLVGNALLTVVESDLLLWPWTEEKLGTGLDAGVPVPILISDAP